GQQLLPQGGPRGRSLVRRDDPERGGYRLAADQWRQAAPQGGGRMKAAILFDAGADHWDQKDIAHVPGNAREIQDCLQARGYSTTLIPIKLGEFGWLNRCRKADVVFNLCEGIDGYSKYEDYVVGTLELTDTPYTGCRPWAVAVCHKKHVANTLL